MTDAPPILVVKDLVTSVKTPTDQKNILRGVSFDLYPGEILGIVGESGCGKSLTGYSLLGLLETPLHLRSGSVKFHDQELVGLCEKQLQTLRGNKISMVFQDPMLALNPVLTIGEQMIETIRAHRKTTVHQARIDVINALKRVGMPQKRLGAYPHEFSGGMRQRVVLATAFLNHPEIIIADEPTTALDVTVQSQILFEVQKMATEFGTAIIWVSHDLALLSGFADRIAVMYAGEVVEIGSTAQIIESPSHPYTRALLNALPINGRETLQVLDGFPPNLLDTLTGCAFAPRCPQASDLCHSLAPAPPESNLASARCHHPL